MTIFEVEGVTIFVRQLVLFFLLLNLTKVLFGFGGASMVNSMMSKRFLPPLSFVEASEAAEVEDETRREVICEVASQCFLQFASASSQKPLVTHKFSSKGS